MIQQPGCPNLYWALTYLPDPLIDLHKALQGESLITEAEYAHVRDTSPMSDGELAHALPGRLALEQLVAARRQEFEKWLQTRVADQTFVRGARERLVAAGLPEERVKAIPAL